MMLWDNPRVSPVRPVLAGAPTIDREIERWEREASASQRASDNAWYCGRLKLARQFQAQAERQRVLAATLRAKGALQ